MVTVCEILRCKLYSPFIGHGRLYDVLQVLCLLLVLLPEVYRLPGDGVVDNHPLLPPRPAGGVDVGGRVAERGRLEGRDGGGGGGRDPEQLRVAPPPVKNWHCHHSYKLHIGDDSRF